MVKVLRNLDSEKKIAEIELLKSKVETHKSLQDLLATVKWGFKQFVLEALSQIRKDK